MFVTRRTHWGNFNGHNEVGGVVTGLAERLRASLAHGYRVERELGEGGMATVYLAHDERHNRSVAVKVLRPELAAAMGTDRFLREIEIAASLVHPHILPLLDSGQADGLPFYVMPYVAGESLRQRLDREKQLPIADAVRITREVAAALQCAHEHGIVHRDIKPENILLEGGSAVVADFGIARAITQSASAEQLTRTGISIGTPAYMSPEQAGAERDIDGRSDIYALGCVLYEMLAGQAPFAGPSMQSIMARHQLDPVPPLRTVRRTVPEALERVVMRALEKVPADRYLSAARFAEALATAEKQATGKQRIGVWQLAWAAGFAAAAGFGSWALSRVDFVGVGSVADTSVVAILALDAQGRFNPDAARLMHDAFGRWAGVTAVDPLRVRDAVERRGPGLRLRPDDLRRIASSLGAGRYVVLELSSAGDSTRARAALLDTDNVGHSLAEQTVRLAPSLAASGPRVAALVDALLLRRTPRPSASRSLPARQSFLRGQDAVAAWSLPEADSAFASALRHDRDYAEASLWLALSRWWAGQPGPRWQLQAEHATRADTQLTGRDRELAASLTAIARSQTVASCRKLDSLARSNRSDFVAWFALGTCLRHDSVVIRDPRSPSGWTFRSSRRRALDAFGTAFTIMPSMLQTVRGNRAVRSLFLIRENQLFTGVAPSPETTAFLAYPALINDTLSFVPFPASDAVRGRAFTRPATASAAIRRQLGVFRNIASLWAASDPGNAEAVEALATSLEMMGNPASIDTLRRARDLAATEMHRVRLTSAEVWLRLKFAIPQDTVGLRRARELADSILRRGRIPQGMNSEVASLAVLTGRAAMAGTIQQHAEAETGRNALGRLGRALVVYATLGGPSDSLSALERRVVEAIAALPPDQQPDSMDTYVARAAELALPHYHMRWWSSANEQRSPLAIVAAALLANAPSLARDSLRTIADQHAQLGRGVLTLDVLYPEAWLLVRVGDTARATTALDRALRDLPAYSQATFADPTRAGALVHAMALRADLATAAGDRATARAFARAVAVLWAHADDFLRPTVRRMQQISR